MIKTTYFSEGMVARTEARKIPLHDDVNDDDGRGGR